MKEKNIDFLEELENKYPDIKWCQEGRAISHIPAGWNKIVADLFEQLNNISKGVKLAPTRIFKLQTKWNRFIYRLIKKINKDCPYLFIKRFMFDPKNSEKTIKGTITIEQIKDKFASLRVYYSTDNMELSPFIDVAINMAVMESSRTCEVSGKPGILRSGGWLRVLCDDEFNKRKSKKEETPEVMGIYPATDVFIASVEKHYENVDETELHQVFQRGPFTGLSELDVLNMVREFKKNKEYHPLNDT